MSTQPPEESPATTAVLTQPRPQSLPPATRGGETKGFAEQFALGSFIFVPFLALLAAVPVAWGWGLGWHDVVIMVVMYFTACHGITVGFHRFFTHGSFKANRALKIALAVAGSLAIEGPVVRWVVE
jgi:stearoyl-CoA desaturase (Delta-9 desaturase)